jgi:threonine dehydrogenase-like Zn-dependent dehydrogenase
MTSFPIGKAKDKNLALKMGDCNHRPLRAGPGRIGAHGVIDPRSVLTKVEPLLSAIDAYKHFDRHEPGWLEVELAPQARAAE